MKSFVALFALLALAAANPLPVVQIIVNIDAAADSSSPIAVDGATELIPTEVDPMPLPVIQPIPIVMPEPVAPVVIPEPVVLPVPVAPEVIPDPAVLPTPVLPVITPEVQPEPAVLPAPVLPEGPIPVNPSLELN